MFRVHVRRTDKVGTEAAYHGLEEYMKEVDFYYDTYELRHKGSLPKDYVRMVYLASDEPEVLKEAPTKYPNYKFMFDEGNAKSAALNSRYTPDSAQGVILDIYFLSQTDFLVCTFSSQVCRLAYELMQVRYPDASWRFRSLGKSAKMGSDIRFNPTETDRLSSFQTMYIISEANWAIASKPSLTIRLTLHAVKSSSKLETRSVSF